MTAGSLGGNVANQGTLQWSGGSLAGVVNNQTTLLIDGEAQHYFNGTLNNAGTVTHTATGSILGWQNTASPATINNLADGVYDFQQGVLYLYSGTSIFNNEGLLRKTSDETATVGFQLNLQDGGDVQVAAGTLNATGGGGATGTYTVSQGDLRLAGGSFALHDGSTGTGEGTLRPTGGTLVVADSDTATLDDLLWVDGGSTGGDGTLRLLGHSLVTAGSLGGNVANQGTLQWSGGSLAGVVNNQTTLLIDGEAQHYFNGTLNNAGTVTHTATGSILGWQNTASPATINNLADGVYDFQQGVLYLYSGTSIFNNEGLLRKTAGETATVGFAVDTTNGTIAVDEGRLDLTGSLANFFDKRLAGGTYLVHGELRFAGADVQTNAAKSALFGPDAAIRGTNGIDALQALAVNEADASLTITDGAHLSLPGTLTNAGHVEVGIGSSLVTLGDYVQTAGRTHLAMNGTIFPQGAFQLNDGSLTGDGTITANVVNTLGQVSPGT